MYPGVQKTGPMPNPKVEIEKIKAQIKEMQIKARMSEIAAKIQSDQGLTQAKIELLKAQAAKTMVEAGGAEKATQLKGLELQIQAEEAKHTALQGYLDLAIKGMENKDDHELGMAGLEAKQGNKGTAGNSPEAG